MTKLTRLPILMMMLLALLAALWGGLARIPWSLPSLGAGLPAAHGPLMVSGFLGTLIAMERAVALRKRGAFGAPLLGVAGAVALFSGLPERIGPLLISLSSLFMVAISIYIVRRQAALYTTTMGLGALSWLVGNLLWLDGRPLPELVLWWAGFLILTIVGERLELSRVTRLSTLSKYLYAAAVGLTLAGSILSFFALIPGVRLASLGFIALALWLARYDIARRTVRQSGLTRYVAVNLLIGYVWLGIGGLLGLRYAGLTAGFGYDARLHALFLGFIFGMVFAHAPIILPALSGLSVPFHRVLYGPPLLMHLALLTRVAGDLALWMDGRRWGGLLNALALLWFLGQMMVLVVTARTGSLKRKTAAAESGP